MSRFNWGNNLESECSIYQEVDEKLDLKSILKRAFERLPVEEQKNIIEFAKGLGYELKYKLTEDGREHFLQIVRTKKYKQSLGIEY